MLGPVICTPLLDRMFIQLQFTLAWYMLIGEHIACHFYPMLSSVTLQCSEHMILDGPSKI